MSSKGTIKSLQTRQKISNRLTKIDKRLLVEKAQEYLTQITNNTKQLPTISGLLVELKISKSRFYELVNELPELADIVETITTRQEEFLLTRGINNQANPVFAMFLLKSKHDYRDQPQQLTQNNYMNISPDVLSDALKLMKENEKSRQG
ncbi:MAG: terminase small subunit [Patescibacteria group bacterium]|jgi:hypothetical protein